MRSKLSFDSCVPVSNGALWAAIDIVDPIIVENMSQIVNRNIYMPFDTPSIYTSGMILGALWVHSGGLVF